MLHFGGRRGFQPPHKAAESTRALAPDGHFQSISHEIRSITAPHVTQAMQQPADMCRMIAASVYLQTRPPILADALHVPEFTVGQLQVGRGRT